MVIPGGWAPDTLRQDERMLNFVREMDKAGKIVAAICHAGWVLCSADILRGRKVTCFKAIKDDMVHAGAEYVDEEVVVDGNLITLAQTHGFAGVLPRDCQSAGNASRRSRRALER